MRLIDADAIHAEVDKKQFPFAMRQRFTAIINKMPTISDKPKAKWLITDAYPHKVYCSNCSKTYAQENWDIWKDGSLPRTYCPSCGFEME